MYYYIKGKYITKGENFIVLETSGIGYKIFTSAINLDKMPLPNENLMMYTHLYVREDIQDLYGFVSYDELTLFLQLLSISGVGPKAALAVMSALTYEQLALAVMTNDTKALTKAQGIGPKAAQRIILELKDKLDAVDALPEEIKTVNVEQQNQISEAVTALTVLGYSANEAKQAVSRVDSDLGVENIIKEALKILTKQV